MLRDANFHYSSTWGFRSVSKTWNSKHSTTSWTTPHVSVLNWILHANIPNEWMFCRRKKISTYDKSSLTKNYLFTFIATRIIPRMPILSVHGQSIIHLDCLQTLFKNPVSYCRADVGTEISRENVITRGWHWLHNKGQTDYSFHNGKYLCMQLFILMKYNNIQYFHTNV